MKISILTLFPNLYEPFLKTSLINRAIEKGHVNVNLKNIFTYSEPKKRIDAPTFGPGSGMLIRPDILEKAIEDQQSCYGKAYKIFFSPQGKKLDQDLLKTIKKDVFDKSQQESQVLSQHVMLIPSRYEGIDSRVEEYYSDLTISIGDYVLMGGDLPAMVLMEGLLRLLPNIVSSQESIEHESFTKAFVDYPEYTEPVVWKGFKVPDVIRSGNHKEIDNWRENIAIKSSVMHHFQWVRSHINSESDIKKVKKCIPSHYVVLMHSDVILEAEREGNSSVTSIDIHDIARSACTFGFKKYFIVTPLADQQKIIKKLLDFWIGEQGISYNVSRHKAIKNVILVDTLDMVLDEIKKLESKEAILIGTTAKEQEKDTSKLITYYDQEKVWSLQKPVLLVLGTARGLSSKILDKCDYILKPIKGFSSFNHLSVRSAASIIFDRWLGINLSN